MSSAPGQLELGAFACVFGDRERTPESIDGLAAICTKKGLGLSLAAMGCGTFWQMTRPLESYITACVSETLAAAGVSPKAVRHIVFATMDKNLAQLHQDLARNVLEPLGLVNCIPAFFSLQQCASSLGALDYAHRLFADSDVEHTVVVAFDFVANDADRVQPFALFGDAVASCLVSRSNCPSLSLIAYAIDVDFPGLVGQDNFESRKGVAVRALERVLRQSGISIGDVEKCFSTNLFKPIALFNMGMCSMQRRQLSIETLGTRAHCGNCDWMINLAHYRSVAGFVPGKKYLAQSYAPGFFSCGLMEARGQPSFGA
jgi:hypothetical protein